MLGNRGRCEVLLHYEGAVRRQLLKEEPYSRVSLRRGLGNAGRTDWYGVLSDEGGRDNAASSLWYTDSFVRENHE